MYYEAEINLSEKGRNKWTTPGRILILPKVPMH